MESKEDVYILIVVLWSILILTIIFINLIDEAKLNSLLVRNNISNLNGQEVNINVGGENI